MTEPHSDPLSHATTLVEVLDRRAALVAETPWLTLYEKDRVVAELTFGALARGAEAWAGRLGRAGVERGDRVLLVLPTERAFFEAFWGILLAGAVPVPAYPPVRLGRMEEYLQTLRSLAENSAGRALVTNETLRPLLRPVEGAGSGLQLLVPEEAAAARSAPAPVEAGDLGLLQYTSGSTGQQKGVALTHGNLLANLRAIGAGARLSPEDVAISWLPLYHDMGLIGLMLGSVYWGIPLVTISPIDFLRRPVRWLRLLSDHRGTVTAGPNFAYSLLARKIRDPDLEGIDLSSCRVALCGAEPIYPATIDAFTRRYEPYGFRREAFFPAYGLAEATLAVSFSHLNAPPILEHVDAQLLEAEGRAVRIHSGGDARAVVSVGRALPTVEVSIRDEEDRELGEGIRGEVAVAGPSVMSGYFRNPEATAQALRGGWLRTGDLGFLLEGRLFICGRKKDLVIKAGRNYFAEDLEAAASTVAGIRPGGLAVFAAENRARGTEEVVLVAEVSEGAREEELADELQRTVADRTGCKPDRVILLPPRTLPKTSSGKVQRFKARQQYLAGTLGSTERKITGPWTYLKAWLKDKLFR